MKGAPALSVYECCQVVRDFVTKSPLHECSAHHYRGKIQCPAPGCIDRPIVVVLEDRASLSPRYYKAGDLIPIESMEFVRTTQFVRQSVLIGDPAAGQTKVYYWERQS